MAVFVASDPAAYEVYMGRWTRRIAAPFLEFVGVRSGHRVLDVGCGTGIITAAAADLGATVVGLDPAEPYLEFARSHSARPSASAFIIPFLPVNSPHCWWAGRPYADFDHGPLNLRLPQADKQFVRPVQHRLLWVGPS